MRAPFSWILLGAFACGGSKPPPTSPACPSGTVLRHGDCVSEAKTEEREEALARAPTEGEKAGDKTPYDHEAVTTKFTRIAKQVRENCGAATDPKDGKANGPWGKTSITITLYRGGSTKPAGVAVPPPFEGKATGQCVVNAFGNLTYPPYAAPKDSTITWDVEILPPAKKP